MEMLLNIVKVLGLVALIFLLLSIIYAIIAAFGIMENQAETGHLLRAAVHLTIAAAR